MRPKHLTNIKKSCLCIFFLFVTLVSYSQEYPSFHYNEVDSAGWITNASGIIITGMEGSEIIKMHVDYDDPGKIELIPTSLFPDKYTCTYNEISIQDTFDFGNSIKKFRPEIIHQENDELLGIRFELTRNFSIFDLTGIVAIRHLFPKTQTLLISEK